MREAMGLSIHQHNINVQTLTGIILGATILMGGAYFLHPFTTENTNAANTDVSVSYTGEDWNIDIPTSTAANAGGLKFEIEGNPAGVNVAKKDTVTGGGTNVPNYQIYVSVNSEGGKIPATSGDSAITATAGTSAAPATLSSNSWGYALANFEDTISYDDLVSSSKSDSWSNSKWAKLPYVATDNLSNSETVEGTAAKIYDSTDPDAGDSVDVYYAVNADNDLASGEYQTTVTYTLIGEIPKDTRSLDDFEYMQDVDANGTAADICENSTKYSATGNKQYTLKDSRTGQSYIIRKLEDEKCWMVQNLYLEGGKTITYENSDLESTTSTTLPSGSTATGSYTLPSSSTSGFNSATQNMYNGSTSTGSYYTWNVATAGVGVYSSNTSPTVSICPKGWKLPTGGSGDEFETLYNKYGYASRFSTPWNFTAVGRYRNGSLGDTSSTYYWSRTGRGLGMDSSNVNPTGNYDKHNGFSVRCVLSNE